MAAGVSLKDIQSIDYSWGEINFEYHPMNRELLMEDCVCEPCEAGGSYDVNMEPMILKSPILQEVLCG